MEIRFSNGFYCIHIQKRIRYSAASPIDLFKSSSVNLTSNDNISIRVQRSPRVREYCARIEILSSLVKFTDDDLNTSTFPKAPTKQVQHFIQHHTTRLATLFYRVVSCMKFDCDQTFSPNKCTIQHFFCFPGCCTMLYSFGHPMQLCCTLLYSRGQIFLK